MSQLDPFHSAVAGTRIQRMDIRATGRMEITTGAGAYTVTGRVQRALLTMLVIRQHTWTPAGVLIDMLWPTGGSGRPETRLHVQVHRLRQRLGAQAIESGPDGYRLVVDPDAVDVWRFRRQVADALAETSHDGADSRALRLLENSVSHWGGTPFPEVDLPEATTERHHLEEMHLRAQEARCQILLDRGESQDALSVLEPLAAAHTSRESLQLLWMTALHRTGRREQAIAVFEGTRQELLALGLEPSSALADARALVLDGVPDTAPGTTSGSCATPSADPDDHGSDDASAGFTATVDPRTTQERAEALRHALSVATDTDESNRLRHELATVLTAKGELNEALSLLGHAEARYRAQRQEDAQAGVLRDMVVVCSLIGDLRRALRLLDEAEELDERTTGTDSLLNTVRALVLSHMGSIDEAQDCLDSARPPSPRNGRRDAQRIVWWRARGQLDRRTGDYPEAVKAAREAYRLAVAELPHSDPGPPAVEVAAALRDAGDAQCFAWFRNIIRCTHRAGRLPLAAFVHASAAKAYLLWADPRTAAAHGTTALDIARRCGCWIFAARAASRLADAEEALGHEQLAAWYRYEALSFYRQVDYPLDQGTRDRLETLAHG